LKLAVDIAHFLIFFAAGLLRQCLCLNIVCVILIPRMVFFDGVAAVGGRVSLSNEAHIAHRRYLCQLPQNKVRRFDGKIQRWPNLHEVFP
jgi:hypothetical protein